VGVFLRLHTNWYSAAQSQEKTWSKCFNLNRYKFIPNFYSAHRGAQSLQEKAIDTIIFENKALKIDLHFCPLECPWTKLGQSRGLSEGNPLLTVTVTLDKSNYYR